MYHLAGTPGRHDRGKVGTMFARQVRLIKTKICSPEPPTIRNGGFSPIHVEIYLGTASQMNGIPFLLENALRICSILIYRS